MFLRILKSNPLISLVFPVLVGLTVWGSILIKFNGVLANSNMPMFDVFWGWLLKVPSMAIFTGFVLVILEAFTWNSFINHESLLKQSSYFPALFYILLFSCRPIEIGFYPPLASSLFLIIAVRRLADGYKKEKALSQAFDAGLCIGIAALLYLPVIVFLVFLWIALLTVRSIIWREWVVSFIGFLLPFIFGLTYYSVFLSPEDFWYDKVLAVATNFKQAGKLSWEQIMLITVLIGIGAISLISFLGRISDNIVKNQKIWTLMIWFACFAVGSVFLSPQKDARAFSLLALPFSFIFSNYFLRARSTWLPELLFILLLVVVALNIYN